MKTTVITSILTLFVFFQSFAQPHEPSNLLIAFNPDTHPDTIAYYRDSLLFAEQVWVSPLTETRLWTLSFPFEYDVNGETMLIENVIDAFTGVNGNRDGGDLNLEGGGLDLKATVSYFPGGAVGVPGLPCGNKFDYYHSQGESPVKIAILDSGAFLEIEGSADYPFKPNVEKITDYIDASNNGEDQNNHGTHLLSIMDYVASKELEGDNSGITYDIRRILDADNRGNVANLIYAAEQAAVDGANIINLSLGFDNSFGNEFFITNMLEALEEHNVLVVASAGNNGYNLGETDWILPATLNYGNFVTVGSVNCRPRKNGFSNYGEYSVDLGMVGTKIDGYGIDGELIALTGTSQAAAIISGMAGVLATHQEEFDAHELKCALMEGVDVYNSLNNKFASAGVANASRSHNILKEGCDNIYDGGPFISPLSKDVQTGDNEIYPNPVSDMLYLKLDQGEYDISIMDIQGRTQFVKQVIVEDDETEIKINLRDFASGGIYFLSTTDATGQVNTHKLVKH